MANARHTAPSLPPACAGGNTLLTSRARRQYRLLHCLGQGGSGTVFAAMALENGQKVALKLWRSAIDGGNATLNSQQQFAGEIRICAQLQHPNMLHLIDHGQDDNGGNFAVYPWLSGQTLKQILSRKGALPARCTMRLMAQVLAALAALHAQKIAHGDLKPHNIMVSGLAKFDSNFHTTLIDFGCAAELAGDAGGALPAQRFCSPAYCAPEQLRGAAPSPAADLYAWGLLLLECLTGRVQVSGQHPAALCRQQLSATMLPLPPCLQGHPLAQILTRVLQKDAKLREQSAGAVLQEFNRLDWRELPFGANDEKAKVAA